MVTLLLVAFLSTASYYFISRATRDTDSLKIQGKVAISEQEVRDIVLTKN